MAPLDQEGVPTCAQVLENQKKKFPYPAGTEYVVLIRKGKALSPVADSAKVFNLPFTGQIYKDPSHQHHGAQILVCSPVIH